MCSPNDPSMVGVFDPCPAFPDCEHYPRACTAASGGATDGEREGYAGHIGSCRMFYAERRCTCTGPASPASNHTPPVASQADGELREELTADLARLLTTWVIGPHENAWNCADAVLALPAVRQLLADAAKVQRVEALLVNYPSGESVSVFRLRRALDSDS